MRGLIEIVVIMLSVAALSGAFVVAGNQAAVFYAGFELSR